VVWWGGYCVCLGGCIKYWAGVWASWWGSPVGGDKVGGVWVGSSSCVVWYGGIPGVVEVVGKQLWLIQVKVFCCLLDHLVN